MLDEEHEGLKRQPKHDENSYILGRIKEHNIAIACLTEYGNNSAAIAAKSMQSTFPNLRFGLLVGIGGGVPSTKNDIRLGDIVISKPTGQGGGVVQYGLGRMEVDGFHRKGTLNKPPKLLRAAVDALAIARKLGQEISNMVNETFGGDEDSDEEWTYPTTARDILFEASYEHIAKNPTCNRCEANTDKIVDRHPRRNTHPKIHYGNIASGNTVIKNALVRDILAERENVICYEMEAAGLMDDFPCLVIRGISDYADSHKNNKWQPYAAAVGAAYAKKLLSRIPLQGVQELECISPKEMVTEIQHTTEKTHNVVQNLNTESHFQKLWNWLSPSDPSTNYNKELPLRHQGSGQWLLQHEAYSRWKVGRSSFLWLHGISGCGKTILSSSIIENLGSDDTYYKGLLYFYFDFTNTSKQSLENAVRSLITQLYQKGEEVKEDLDSLYSSCRSGIEQPSIESLCGTLQSMIQRIGEAWIVLDALDECPTRNGPYNEGLFFWMKDLLNYQQANIHLLVTSRPEQDIEAAINKWSRDQSFPVQSIAIKTDLISNDICSYISARVRDGEGLKRWSPRGDQSEAQRKAQKEIQDEIETSLTAKANGMFRWVSCQLDVLENCLDPLTLRKALNSMPTTLNATYDRILASVPATDEGHTKRILQFLAFSERPLRIDEAVDVIAVQTDESPPFDPSNRMPIPDEITRYCSSLVVVVTRENSEDGNQIKELQLAHFSVKEYLTSGLVEERFKESMGEATARGSITRVCLSYLWCLDPALNGLKFPHYLYGFYRIDKKVKTEFPLAEYSLKYWAGHARFAAAQAGVQQSILHFLSKRDKTMELWYRGYSTNSKKGYPREDIGSSLYLAASAGFEHAVSLLLKGEDVNYVNVQSGRCGNLLHVASREGYEEIVKFLIKSGADVNLSCGYCGNALLAACQNGHTRIAQTLLENGADINLEHHDYGKALHAASLGGHEDLVQMLLGRGSDVNSQNGVFGYPLVAASWGGHKGVVQILLQKGADVNARNPGSRFDKSQIRRVQHGIADISWYPRIVIWLGNALKAARERGHLEIEQMLLDAGAIKDAGDYLTSTH
ncbi:hypothetical protein TWF281_011250 [Arthrobotrys megalospora]